VGWFKQKEHSRSELVRDLSSHLVKAQLNFASYAFNAEMLGLLPCQSFERGLAEWHAIMISGTVYAMWRSLGTQEKIFPVLDAFKPAFLRSLEPGCRAEFASIANVREDEYVPAIGTALQKAESMLSFLAHVGRRISGHTSGVSIPESPGNAGADFLVALALERILVTHLTSTKKLFDELQLTVPTTFIGPIDG
jgi:hypothetical protein